MCKIIQTVSNWLAIRVAVNFALFLYQENVFTAKFGQSKRLAQQFFPTDDPSHERLEDRLRVWALS